jgi:hypothetical protein
MFQVAIFTGRDVAKGASIRDRVARSAPSSARQVLQQHLVHCEQHGIGSERLCADQPIERIADLHQRNARRHAGTCRVTLVTVRSRHRLLGLLLLQTSLAHAAPEVAFGVGAGLLPSRHAPSTLDVTVIDTTGARWDLRQDVPASLVTPGLTLRVDVRWKHLTVGLDAAIAFASFANEAGKTGRTYGATLTLPLGLRQTVGPFDVSAFAGPSLVFGGYGFGTLARKDGAPITFGETRFFDDETALHLLDTSFGLTAGLDVRVPLTPMVSLFAQVSGLTVLWSSRAFNLAGYADEAQSRVEWSRRSLDDPALAVRFDGRRFDARASVFGFDGPRFLAGLEVVLR